MGARLTRRLLLLRVARAAWRYYGRVDAHHDAYERELATTLHTLVTERLSGRLALGSYRLAMRLLTILAIALAAIALLLAASLWRLEPWSSLLALVPAVPAALLLWWRLAWGAPLDWLEEHADPNVQLPLSELPERLQQLANETRSLANAPARLSEELDALAAEVADG